MKSNVNLILFLLLLARAAFADSPAIQQMLLDDHSVVTVPVATNRVTTISFPGPIEALDGAGFTVDGKTPGQFQLGRVNTNGREVGLLVFFAHGTDRKPISTHS
jgi:hypothetical protein